MSGYTKEFLIGAFVSRYECLGLDIVEQQYQLAKKFSETVSVDKFRQYCSLDAEAIRQYKEHCARVV
jgi:hypothetical protein